MNAPKSVGYTRDQLVELFTEHASDGWSGDAAALSPEQAADAILALSGPVSGMDTRPSNANPAATGPQPRIATEAEPSGLGYPETADRKHTPELETWATNQKPKTAQHRDARLYRYVGTDLYQWFSTRGTSVFEDPFGEPFTIKGATATEAQHAGQWRPIESAPRDGTRVWAWYGPEGFDVCWYDLGASDAPDDMGYDAGWWGHLYAVPGRSFGNPDHQREPQGQPTHWQPLPVPPAAPPSPAPPSSEREGSRAGDRS